MAGKNLILQKKEVYEKRRKIQEEEEETQKMLQEQENIRIKQEQDKLRLEQLESLKRYYFVTAIFLTFLGKDKKKLIREN